MCKHILINNFTPSDLDTLSNFTLMTRDDDGYGAIIRTRVGDIETIKSLNQGDFYIELTKRLLKDDVQTLVVHHRTSTNFDGIEYAHPFEFAGYHLTHNGVVSVPGKHDTKTENDSEALLHHLVKTSWDTESIKGYFSCFVLTSDETRVIVDDTAPMFTDGRVYSSHRLDDSYKSCQLVHLTMGRDGRVSSETPVKIVKTTYGMDKAGLSLGLEYPKQRHERYETSYPLSYFDDYPSSRWDNVELFVDCLSREQELHLVRRSVRSDFNQVAQSYAQEMGLELSPEEISELQTYFQP